jgi:hypothetical protein
LISDTRQKDFSVLTHVVTSNKGLLGRERLMVKDEERIEEGVQDGESTVKGL